MKISITTNLMAVAIVLFLFFGCKKSEDGNGNNPVTNPCDGQTVLSYAGQDYQIVEIGNQCWMAENLNYETFDSWRYDSISTYGDVYGRLYTWEAMMNGDGSSNTVPSEVQGICPSGWHVPSRKEWKVLEIYLGVSPSDTAITGFVGTVEGKKMKSTSGWHNNGNGTNSSGFNGLAGGYRNSHSGTFHGLSYTGRCWSSTEYSSTQGYYSHLYYDSEQIIRDLGGKEFGISVRCLKD